MKMLGERPMTGAEIQARFAATEAGARSRARTKERRSTPEHRRKENERTRLARTGHTPENVENLWNDQQGQCGVCSVVMCLGNKTNRRMCADHEHVVPPRPRGLLCHACNVHLGAYEANKKEQPRIEIAAFDAYLERWK